MKKLAGLLVVIFGLFSAPANAACVGGTCFAIATGNWGTAGTWSITSGGVSCVCTPATGDAIVLDAASGAVTVTMEAAYSIASLDATGFTGTLTQNAFTMTVSGNTFKLVAGMTYTPVSPTRIISFTSASGTTAITTAGKTLGGIAFGTGPVTTGTYQLQDAIIYRSDGAFTLTGGTFDANNFNVTGGVFSSNNSNTRAVLMGSGTWTINGTSGSVWDVTTATGYSVTPSSSTLNFSATPIGARTITLGASKSYGVIGLVSAGSTSYSIDFNSTAVTIATLNVTAPIIIRMTSATTYTVTNAFNWNGTSSTASIVFVNTSVLGTISVASGSPVINWGVLGNITFSGGATFAATNTINAGGVSGITISGPSSGGGGRIIGGWLFDNDNAPRYIAKVT